MESYLLAHHYDLVTPDGKEKKILNSEYDFIDKILQKRGVNKINKTNLEASSKFLIKSLEEFFIIYNSLSFKANTARPNS